MSRIDEMLQRLSPDGVEFVPLGELVRIRNGRDYKHLSDGNIPVYGSGGVMTYVNASAYDGPSVLIPRKGSLNNVFFVDVPFWTVDTIFYTEIGGRLEPKYLYYLLKKLRLGSLNQAAGVPSQTQKRLNKLRIPAPPLEIQREIVGILDQFTQLEARRRQFSLARREILGRAQNITKTTLGALCVRVVTGATPKAGFDKYYSGGTIPWLRTGEVNFNRIRDTEVKITDVAVHETGVRWVSPHAVIIAISGATAGRVCITDIPLTTNQHCANLEVDPEQADYRFVYHWVAANYESLKRMGRGARRDLNLSLIKGFPVHLPPLGEQERMAQALDEFETLIGDHSRGLPAEIAARRKQYEYYRDKLLTFEEKV